MAKSMTKTPPTIKVRRAIPEDVVNIYRLVRKRTETVQPHFLGVPEPHRGMAFLLDLIQNGYVIVADLSGRIVGCLGCSVYEVPHGPKDSWVMDAEFTAFAPGFEDNGTGAALLQNVRTFVLKNELPLRIIASKSDQALFGESLVNAGFTEEGVVYTLGVSDGTVRRREEDDDQQSGAASVDGRGGPEGD
jgi:hypothetical protein